MKLTSLEITLPDGRRFIADADVERTVSQPEHIPVPTPFGTDLVIDTIHNTVIASVEILTLHQLVEIGDEKTLNAVEAQIEKDLT